MGSITTSQDGELIYAYGSFTSGYSGEGYLERSRIGNDCSEDRMAWKAGTYSASFINGGSGWVGMAVAFKSASVPSDTNGLVQRILTHQNTAGNTLSTTFDQSNVAGNLIVVMVYCWSNSQTLTVSDTKGNTYHLANSVSQVTDGHQIWIYYAENILSGTNRVTVTVSGSASTYIGLILAEYSGIVSSNSFDKSQINTSNASTSLTSGSTTSLSTSSQLLIGYFGMSEGGTGFSPTSSFELKGHINHSIVGKNQSAFIDRVVNSVGAYAATGTTGGGGESYTGIIATFKRITNSSVIHKIRNY